MRTEIVSYGSEPAGVPEWIPLVFLGFIALILAAAVMAGRRKRELFEALSSFLQGEAGGQALPTFPKPDPSCSLTRISNLTG